MNCDSLNVRVVHADLRNVDTLTDLGRAVHRYRALQLLISGSTQTPSLPADRSSFYRRIERLSLAKFSKVPDDVKRVLLSESSDNPQLTETVQAYIDSCDPYKPTWIEQSESRLLDRTASVSSDNEIDEVDDTDDDIDDDADERRNELVPFETSKAGVLPPPDTLIVSFPPEDGKTHRKGLLTREFRRFIRSIGAKRVVLVSPNASALSKDMGHLELLGYSLESIKIFDVEPHSMKIQAVAVLNLLA